MATKCAWPVLCLAALALIQSGGRARADEAGCLVVGAWDEARGEPKEVIEAVVSTIVNRARSRGISVCDAVMDPAALTGVTPAMHEVFSEAAKPHGGITPQANTGHDREQLAAVEAAAAAAVAGTLPDRSKGATHFYSPSGMRELGLAAAPGWAASMTETAKVGPFVFLRERGLSLPPQTHVAAAEPELASVPAPRRPREPIEAEPAAPAAAADAAAPGGGAPGKGAVATAAIEPITLAPLPPTELLPVRRMAPPVEVATVVLDPGSYLDIRKAGKGPRMSIVSEAAAAEIAPATAPAGQAEEPAETEPAPKPEQPAAPQPAAVEMVQALPPPPTPTALMPRAPTPLLVPKPAQAFADGEVQNDGAQNAWARPAWPPLRAWAPIRPVAEYIPPPPRVPAIGYWSPEAGTWLACRGSGTRAILVEVHGRRLWRPTLSGVRCGM